MAAYRWLACSIGSLIELGKLGVTLSGDQCDTYDFNGSLPFGRHRWGSTSAGRRYIYQCVLR
jgi:hypothetical protein